MDFLFWILMLGLLTLAFLRLLWAFRKACAAFAERTGLDRIAYGAFILVPVGAVIAGFIGFVAFIGWSFSKSL